MISKSTFTPFRIWNYGLFAQSLSIIELWLYAFPRPMELYIFIYHHIWIFEHHSTHIGKFKIQLWRCIDHIRIPTWFICHHASSAVHAMMTSSNGNIFRVTGPLCGEFTGPGEFPAQRPVTRSFGVFFHLRLNKRLSKQPRGWWFETPPWSLWRHCNATFRNGGSIWGSIDT